jgi:hypothetical protein
MVLDLPSCYPQQLPVVDVGLPLQLPAALSHEIDIRRILRRRAAALSRDGKTDCQLVYYPCC